MFPIATVLVKCGGVILSFCFISAKIRLIHGGTEKLFNIQLSPSFAASYSSIDFQQLVGFAQNSPPSGGGGGGSGNSPPSGGGGGSGNPPSSNSGGSSSPTGTASIPPNNGNMLSSGGGNLQQSSMNSAPTGGGAASSSPNNAAGAPQTLENLPGPPNAIGNPGSVLPPPLPPPPSPPPPPPPLPPQPPSSPGGGGNSPPSAPGLPDNAMPPNGKNVPALGNNSPSPSAPTIAGSNPPMMPVNFPIQPNVLAVPAGILPPVGVGGPVISAAVPEIKTFNVTLNPQLPYPLPPNPFPVIAQNPSIPTLNPPFPLPPNAGSGTLQLGPNGNNVPVPILPTDINVPGNRNSLNISIIEPPRSSASPPFPLPGGNSIPSQETCYCAPYGYCAYGPNTISDGTGNIDIRIVTNNLNCQPGTTQCCQGKNSQCGIRYINSIPNAPVSGPGQAPYGAYPWQAAILGPSNEYVGSGALISSLFILTIAHRIVSYVNNPEVLKIRLGEWDAAGVVEPIRPQEYLVVSIVVNPYFNIGNLQNDIAIIRLIPPVPLGQIPTIGTVCLPPVGYLFDGSSCWVSGWGQNSFTGGTYQYIQKQVNVPILPASICQIELSSTRLGPTFLFNQNSFICAGGQPGMDACVGDGGSPLVCPIGNKWFLAGLVAWGIGCGMGNVPGVYVNVATYIPWIESIIINS